MRGEVVGERGEVGGIAAQPLHLVHGEDDPAVRGMGLDLAGGGDLAQDALPVRPLPFAYVRPIQE
ncbi:hypothetical protein [Streptomyces sp. NPDC085540]|uniref:hypothetical protein n=1 Tax=Streptomyces sp. NPDC085540 TaxID=3365730 RepID=UPI0037CE2D9B